MADDRVPATGPGGGLAATARDLLDRLAALDAADDASRDALLDEALHLAEQLRRDEAMDVLARFSDALRQHTTDANRTAQAATLSAQALADRGQPFAALDVLRAAPAPIPGSDAWLEWQGLQGRTNKQIFLAATDRRSPRATAALDAAIAAYLAAFRSDPAGATWHGVNLAALAHVAASIGRPVPADADPAQVAATVRRLLDAVPPRDRDAWWHASQAEAALAAGDPESFVRHVKRFVDDPSTSAFALASFLRQLTEVWDLETGGSADSRALVDLLRAALLRRRGGAVRIDASQAVLPADRVPAGRFVALEKVFGPRAPKDIAWWALGLERARSVAAICTTDELGRVARAGSGFLVAVRGPGGEERRLVLTNAHVVGARPPFEAAIAAEQRAMVRFEALSPGRLHAVRSVVWTSDPARHDATLLEIEDPPDGLAPLPLHHDVPPVHPARARLYVIGHPRGQGLAFSFEDNELLDHEGPPSGRPAEAGVVRLHYRTPTEPGSSGSPAFVEERWQAVALHHAGQRQMRRLNGHDGTYEANEGVSLASIAEALRAETGLVLVFGGAGAPA